MCLAVPGRVEEIHENNYAMVNFGGIRKQICLDLLSDVKIGDYVNVHVGFAINKIDEKQAEDNLRFIRDAYSNNREI